MIENKKIELKAVHIIIIIIIGLSLLMEHISKPPNMEKNSRQGTRVRGPDSREAQINK